MKSLVVLTSLLITFNSFAKIKETKPVAVSLKGNLLSKYIKDYKNKKDLIKLKKETLALSGKSVPALIEVMKNSKYPDKNRWVATFLLGQIMGEKSAPFVSKFMKHPSWVMRMASLKTLLALKQSKYESDYGRLLKDKSFIVRSQALENIKTLKLKKAAPVVWSMLYRKENYYQPKVKGKKKAFKRSNIIKKVISTVGELEFKEAKKPLLKMIQKKKYVDIFSEIDTSLSKITGKKSPKGNRVIKKNFWKKYAMKEATI